MKQPVQVFNNVIVDWQQVIGVSVTAAHGVRYHLASGSAINSDWKPSNEAERLAKVEDVLVEVNFLQRAWGPHGHRGRMSGQKTEFKRKTLHAARRGS